MKTIKTKLKDDSEDEEDVDRKIYIKARYNASLENSDIRELSMAFLCFYYFDIEKE